MVRLPIFSLFSYITKIGCFNFSSIIGLSRIVKLYLVLCKTIFSIFFFRKITFINYYFCMNRCIFITLSRINLIFFNFILLIWFITIFILIYIIFNCQSWCQHINSKLFSCCNRLSPYILIFNCIIIITSKIRCLYRNFIVMILFLFTKCDRKCMFSFICMLLFCSFFFTVFNFCNITILQLTNCLL